MLNAHIKNLMANSKTDLTVKQKRFVEFYDGNGTEAARKAGYKGNDNTLNQVAIENLRKPMILEAIEKRESERLSEGILDREKRQIFWSEVIEDKDQKMPDRLRASELLGKSEADFIDKQEIDIENSINIGVIRLPELKPEGAEVEVLTHNKEAITDGLDTESRGTDRDTAKD